jgi:hypothetical protein
MPSPTGYHTTGPIVEIRRGICRNGDDLRGAFGICRGLLIGAALWSVVAVVAVAFGSAGDARDVPNPPVAPVAATPHPTTAIVIDRGGHH